MLELKNLLHGPSASREATLARRLLLTLWLPCFSCATAASALATSMCSADVIGPCVRQALWDSSLTRLPPAIELDEARSAFEQACRNGDALGCVYLGPMFEFGRGVEPDPARADELYVRACRQDEEQGCVHHAIRLERSGPLREAEAIYASVCERIPETSTGGRGCFHLGRLVASARAEALYRQGCAWANGQAREAAAHIDAASTDPQVRARGERALHKICERGVASACATQ